MAHPFYAVRLKQLRDDYLNAKKVYEDFVVTCAEDGMSQREIAAACGISHSNIRYILLKAGVTYEFKAQRNE